MAAVGPTFLEHAQVVMAQREKDLRGHDRDASRFRCHLATAPFAHKPLAEIRPREIRAWLRDLSVKPAMGAGRVPGEGRTLAYETVERCKSLAAAVFSDAVDNDIIEMSPALSVKLRKRVDARDTIVHWAYLTHAEQKAFAACKAIPIEHRLMVAVAAHTGMRQGEQYHLPLSDVVLDGPDPHIHVRIAGHRKDGSPLPPKNGKPRRVPLLPPAVSALRTWLLLLPTWAPSNPHGLVFPWSNGSYRQSGKPLGHHARFKVYLAAAGITVRPYLCWHSLRHTFGSNLISGVYAKRWTIEEIRPVLGHSSTAMSERYSHLGEDDTKRTARETAEAMRKAKAA